MTDTKTSTDLLCCPNCNAWTPTLMFGRKLQDKLGRQLDDRPEDFD